MTQVEQWLEPMPIHLGLALTSGDYLKWLTILFLLPDVPRVTTYPTTQSLLTVQAIIISTVFR